MQKYERMKLQISHLQSLVLSLDSLSHSWARLTSSDILAIYRVFFAEEVYDEDRVTNNVRRFSETAMLSPPIGHLPHHQKLHRKPTKLHNYPGREGATRTTAMNT
jgi:hypothetical protein